MQDTVASELGMERGQSAEITGTKHMSPRAFKAQKRQEAAIAQNNKEWEAKMAEKQAEWEARKAEWEAKLAEREAKREEWEKKIPEIIAARERRSKYICEQLDWENARTGKMLAREMQMLGVSFAGINNPQGNILVEAQKSAIRNIFYMLGVTAQLAVVLMKKTIANDEKLAADAKIFNVESTLLRAVDYIANSDKDNGEELKIRIQRTFLGIPEDKREELFAYALENAPTPELKNDIKALIEGRFEDIAKSEQAQRRIENRDLKAELKAYSEEIRKIKEDLRAMDEENRVLNLAERELLKQKGANRSEYADQEAENRKRIEDIKKLKDDVKALNNTIQEQKQREQKDAETIKKQAAQIKELNEKIEELTDENAKKQKELEAEKEQAEKDKIELKDKIEELEAEKIIPQDIFDEINRVHYGIEPETPHDMAIDERDAALDERDEALKRVKELENELKRQPKPAKIEQKPEGAFDILDELEKQIKEAQPEPKIEQPKPEPEPIAKKDDFTNIYGYSRPQPEPRRRFGDDYERKREPDRPRYVEPEPIREPEPEKIEQREEQKDEWQEIEEAMKKWQKTEDIGEKTLITMDILAKLKAYEKSGLSIPPYRELMINGFRHAANYDPIADELEAQKNAETLRKLADMNREREERKRQAEIETSVKYEDVKVKNVRKEDDTRQHNIKKKKKEDYEMGMS